MRSRTDDIYYLPVSNYFVFLNNNKKLHTIKRVTSYNKSSMELDNVKVSVSRSPSIIIFEDQIQEEHHHQRSKYSYYDSDGNLLK